MSRQQQSEPGNTALGDGGVTPEIDFDINSLSCNFLHSQHRLFLALSEARSFPETMDLCMDAALQVSTMECGAILLLEGHGNLRLVHTRGVSTEFIDALGKHSANSAFTRDILRGVSMYEIHPEWGKTFSNWKHHEGLKSFALIPLRHKQRITGGLVMASPRVEGLTPSRRFELETLSSLIGMLINESQVDEALRASQARYEAIFEQAAVGIAQMSPEGHWLRVNRKFCEIVGYSREELLTLDYQTLTPEDTVAADVESVRRLCAGEFDNYTKEKRYIRKDGSYVWVNLTVSLARHTDGDGDSLIAVIEDIQARKESEQMLRRFSRVIEQTASAIFTTDSRGIIDYVNPRFTEISGYTFDEAINKSPPVLLKSEFAEPGEEQRLLQTIQKGSEWKGELCNYRRDGTPYWVSVIVSPVRDEEGQITNYVAIHDDISERKYAETALKSSEKMLKQAQRMAHIGNWKRDLVADTASWSDVIYHIFGRDPSLPPATFAEMPQYFTPESWRRLWAGIKKAIHGGIPYDEDAEVVRPDGSRRWVHSHGEAEYDRDGNIIALNGMLQDITERKSAEEVQKRLARAMKLLSQCRMSLVHAGSEEQLLTDFCHHCVETGNYVMTWVGFVADHEAGTVRPAAYAGPGDGLRDGIDKTWTESHAVIGQTCNAIRNGSTVVTRNYLNNPERESLGNAAAGCEYHSSIALPLIINKRVEGALNIFSSEPNGFSQEEVVLLEELAGDLAYGIDTMRNRIERKRAEAALAEREAQYQAVIDSTTDGFWVIGAGGRLLAVNDAYVRRSGYSREELLTMRISDLEAQESSKEVQAHITRVQENGSDLFESLHRTREGEIWPVEINTSYLPEAGGRFYVFVRDITQRKILERQIIEVSTAEQERIGREIHDGIGQQLTAVGMLASSLERKLIHAKQMEQARDANDLVIYLKQLIGSAKSLAKGLSPIQIGPNGLPDALSMLVESVKSFSGLDCHFNVMGEVGELDEIIAVHLYRITQEAINNAIKHSQADTLEVCLKSDQHQITLSVSDNGIGIDLAKKTTGLGLHIMRYRAGIIGAAFSITPVTDGGTRVECTWHRKS